MGQATVKAARRQIRRAFGAEAIGTLADHHQAIVTLSAILEQTRQQGMVLVQDFKTLTTNLPSPNTFRARLRWLFFGN